jgi:membrane protein insertase Oxa1/YidC/SpoIIIJ
MRHAPFFGWIKDLSAPDPTSIVNLFGLLPFAVPEFLHIGVWPIIMGATMWVQMQLNPQQPDPMQQRIFNWMPVLFTFLLASFSVGLVIYWAWNNVLSLLQQYAIMRKNGAEIHLWKNLGIDKLQARLRPADAVVAAGPATKPAKTEPAVAVDGARMSREDALKELGLKQGATQKEIDAAYNTRSKQNGLNGAGSRLSEARDVLRGKP